MEISDNIEQDKSVSSVRGWLFKLCLFAVLCCWLFAAYKVFNSNGWGDASKVVIGLVVFIVLAPISWSIGNIFRKFVAPDSYLTFGTGDAFKKKVFWLVGPQWSAFTTTLLVVAFFTSEFIAPAEKTELPASVTASQVQAVEAPVQQDASTATPAPVEASSAPAAESQNPTTLVSTPSTVPQASESNAGPQDAAKQHGTEFVVVAPPEAKPHLEGMLKHAVNALKLAELKGLVEQLPKPVTGDRKTARQLNEKGLAALKAENSGEAINMLQQAVAADPADVEVRNNYVYALLKSKKLDVAEREVGLALTYAPGRSSAWANLAEIYAEMGNTNSSASALIVAFQFSSNKDKTLTFLNEKAAAVENASMSEAAKLALSKLKSG